MKKTVLIVLTILLLIGNAYAEALNVSDMTDDELLSAYERIKVELQNRNITIGTERTLRDGKYIIGRDIPAGTYTVTCIGTTGESVGESYGALGDMLDALDDDGDDNWGSLYNSLGGIMGDYYNMTIEIIGDYGDVLASYDMKKDDSFSIVLNENTALKITDGSCTIKSE